MKATGIAVTYPRRRSQPVKVGNIVIGGNAPVSIQSMVNTDPRNVRATLAQKG